MFEHLLRLSLHQELRRGHGYDPARQTIDGATATRLLQGGLAEVSHSMKRPTGGRIEWVRLSDYGRKRLDWLLENKL
jgi:hypothetical protein